jgi:hypothetical protein
LFENCKKWHLKNVNSLRRVSDGKVPTMRFAARGDCEVCCSGAGVWTAVKEMKWGKSKYGGLQTYWKTEKSFKKEGPRLLST